MRLTNLISISSMLMLMLMLMESLCSCVSYPQKNEMHSNLDNADQMVEFMNVTIVDNMDNVFGPKFEKSNFYELFLKENIHQNKTKISNVDVNFKFNRCGYSSSDKQDGVGKRVLSIFTFTLYPIDFYYTCSLETEFFFKGKKEIFIDSFDRVDRWGIVAFFALARGGAPVVAGDRFFKMKRDLILSVVHRILDRVSAP